MKRYAVTVFGATGYTGGLVAESMARYAPPGTAWAIAGRSRSKLEACRARLAELPCPPGGLLLASSDDRPSLDALCAESGVVATTVGPFARLGGPLAEACVAAGCDYVDSTGEPAFVAQLVGQLDARAKDAGVRLIPCAAFESLPIDYGAWLTARELPQDAPLEVRGYLQAKGGISGGTWSSILEALAEPKASLAAMDALLPKQGRPCRLVPRRVHRVARLTGWSCPLPSIDGLIVLRSASVAEGYGRAFAYGHHVQVPSLATVAAGVAGFGALCLAARFGPLRRLLARALPAGSGPGEEARAEGRYRIDWFGSGGGEHSHTRLWGTRDPGYVETGNFVAAAALALALERPALPERAGVLSPVAALGEAGLTRLAAAGIRFSTS
ncbi:MAG: saccharopine dehydrogenase NADP-binding domain-containing protein [Planctomycetes bacterium]|nr:saccharopine dehydrogenase NADP-binding domain-containing protein [Planctomycetota bacterium]